MIGSLVFSPWFASFSVNFLAVIWLVVRGTEVGRFESFCAVEVLMEAVFCALDALEVTDAFLEEDPLVRMSEDFFR